MPLPPSAFAQVPILRGKIVEPEQSSFRISRASFDAWDARAASVGYPANWRRSHEEREAIRRAALGGRFDRDLWIFAYGSLMWDPAIHLAEIRRATLRGFHRRFCLKIEIGRGSPEAPSLMAALDAGGACDGLAFRIPAEIADRETEILWMREMISEGYVARFLPVDTPQGPVDAVAFVIDKSCSGFVDLSVADAAAIIANGRGVFGENIEYFDNLAEKVEALGISDSVFEEISAALRLAASR